jgi:hypothetical protein
MRGEADNLHQQAKHQQDADIDDPFVAGAPVRR